jgi:hypothetical protein
MHQSQHYEFLQCWREGHQIAVGVPVWWWLAQWTTWNDDEPDAKIIYKSIVVQTKKTEALELEVEDIDM